MQIDNDWLQQHLVSGMAITKYGYTYRRPADRIELADGENISVQASTTHYSTPRNNDGPYTAVEIGYPSAPPEWWDDSEGGVMGYMPVEQVIEYINQHGGVA